MYSGKKGVSAVVQSMLGGIISVAAVLMAAILICIFLPAKPVKSADDTDGIRYIKSQESADVEEVDRIRLAQREAVIQAQRQEIGAEIEAGTKSIFSYFTDYAIMGDSRAVGFYYYGFLAKERVIADGGWTIRDIEEHLAELKNLHPGMVFLCFGLNDVSIGYWDSPEAYALEYKEILERLHEELPTTTFYVSSILPARDPAFDRSAAWRDIPVWSDTVKVMCREEGIPFVECSEIAAKYDYLWDVDGIHVTDEFYPHWARQMIAAVYVN